MSFVGRAVGAIGGFALGGPIGAMAGFAAGSSVDSASAERRAYRNQAANIEEQKRLNQEIEAFNLGVINKLYPETLETIKLQTRNVLARQMMAFAHSGASPGSASPFFTFGEINRMGEMELQRAAFNHDVDLRNEEFKSKSIQQSLDSDLINARYRSKAAGLKMFEPIWNGAQLFSGMYRGNMFRYGNPFGSWAQRRTD